MPIPHRKTRKIYNAPGDSHFLTFSTFKRLPLLTKQRSCQWVVDAIVLSRERNPFDLWAWVIMPEHVHLVLYPHEGIKIASILSTIKQSSSKRAMNWLRYNAPHYLPTLADVQPNGKRTHRFWQRGGGYDRSLRTFATFMKRWPISIRIRSFADWNLSQKTFVGQAPGHGKLESTNLFPSTDDPSPD